MGGWGGILLITLSYHMNSPRFRVTTGCLDPIVKNKKTNETLAIRISQGLRNVLMSMS